MIINIIIFLSFCFIIITRPPGRRRSCGGPSERDQMGSALTGSLQISCFLTEGLLWVPICQNLSRSRTSSPNLSRVVTFAATPLALTPFVREHIYIYREREIERERDVYIAIYIYIYIQCIRIISYSLSLSLYINIYIYPRPSRPRSAWRRSPAAATRRRSRRLATGYDQVTQHASMLLKLFKGNLRYFEPYDEEACEWYDLDFFNVT